VSTVISLLDVASAIVAIAALVAFCARRPAAKTGAGVLVFALLCVVILHHTSNALEWSGITGALDAYEDYMQLLEPVLFAVVAHGLLQSLNEREIRESRERYRLLFNNGNDAVFFYYHTPDWKPGLLSEVNDIACRMLGYSRDELTKMTFVDIIDQTSLKRIPAQEITGRLKEEKHLLYERTLRAKDGRRIPVEISSHSFQIGEAFATLALARDVSAREELEERMRQSQRLESVGRLAGGVAHDFNNLLTVIAGYADSLRMDLSDDSPLHEDIEEIRSAASRAAALTRQLLAFSRRQVMQPRIVDLRDLIAGTRRMLARLIGEDIDLQISIPQELGHVRADPRQIEQVIVNLAVNSRDAMPRGGAITVSLREVLVNARLKALHPEMTLGLYVLMLFSDTGEGMSPEVQKRIFEPFFTTKGVGKGTGLGLSTAYGIVKQSGGYIYVKSRPGSGTVFEIYLPVIAGTEDESKGASVVSSHTSASGCVLVVEDEDSVRSLVANVLRQRGFEVFEATSGEEALELCAAEELSPDVVVSDVVMPGIRGDELSRRLAKEYPRIRTLLISGYVQEVSAPRDAAGEDLNLLEKPFTPEELLNKLDELLEEQP
jgi:PAS domain S-box-containing protein